MTQDEVLAARFRVKRALDSFESGNLLSLAWSGDGNRPWTVQNQTAASEQKAGQSGPGYGARDRFGAGHRQDGTGTIAPRSQPAQKELRLQYAGRATNALEEVSPFVQETTRRTVESEPPRRPQSVGCGKGRLASIRSPSKAFK